MRVLHVAPLDFGRVGGLQYSVIALCEALCKCGVDVSVVSSVDGTPLARKTAFPMLSLPKMKERTLRSVLREVGRPDLAVFHSTYIPSQARLARQCKKAGLPYIVVPRGGMMRGAQARKKWKKVLGNAIFFNQMIRNCSAIHCLNKNEAKDVEAWGRPWFISPNGIDLPTMPLRLDRSGQGEGIRFLFLGRLDVQGKGLDLMLEAVARVAGDLRRTRSRLDVFGPSSEPGAGFVRRRAERDKIDDIVVLHEAVAGEAKRAAYAQAGCFLHFSRSEGHPIAVLEAMAHALPCAVTPETNMGDLIVGSRAGWVLEGNAKCLAEGLLRILKQEGELLLMGERARELVRREYDWRDIADSLRGVYEELLTGR